MVGTLNSIAQIAGTTGDALITNTDGSLISLTNGATGGGTNLISQIAGANATITNAPTNTTLPSTITMDGKVNAITQVTTTGDATITNPDGSLISLTGGGSNLISQIAGDTATITNDSPATLTSTINMVGSTNSILQVAANGATISNLDGSLISQTGGGTNLVSQIVTAGPATITNTNGAGTGTSTITMAGTANSILQVAGGGVGIGDALITNTDGSLISLTGGGTNLISQIAGDTATITNDDPSTINMVGSTNSILQAAANGATISNLDGSLISQTGGGTNLVSQVVTAGPATITNTNSVGDLEPAPSRWMAPPIRSFRLQEVASALVMRSLPTPMAR